MYLRNGGASEVHFLATNSREHLLLNKNIKRILKKNNCGPFSQSRSHLCIYILLFTKSLLIVSNSSLVPSINSSIGQNLGYYFKILLLLASII